MKNQLGMIQWWTMLAAQTHEKVSHSAITLYDPSSLAAQKIRSFLWFALYDEVTHEITKKKEKNSNE